MRCVTDVNLSDNTRLFFPGNDGFQPEDRDDTIAIVCQPRLCTQRIVTPRLSTVDVLDTATQQHTPTTGHNSAKTTLQLTQRVGVNHTVTQNSRLVRLFDIQAANNLVSMGGPGSEYM